MVYTRYGNPNDDLFLHHTLDTTPVDNLAPDVAQMHAHENYEIYYFVSGECSYMVEGQEYLIYPGCLMIMRPAEVHSLKVSGNSNYERVVINFSEEVLKPFDPEGLLLEPYVKRSLGAMNLYEPGDFGKDISKYLFLAAGTAEDGREPPEQRLAIICNLLPLLFDIREVFLKRDSAGQEAEPRDNLEILDYINRNLCDDLSLDKLADKFFLSKSQLIRRFRSLTGTTVGEYVTAKRLILARDYIRAGSTALDACRRCGFYDYSAFYRAYRKKFKVSPKWAIPYGEAGDMAHDG